jgi:hypothetical protein
MLQNYRVRDGFNFLLPPSNPEKPAKQYDSGEEVALPEEIGDNAHQLERVPTPVKADKFDKPAA